MSLTFRLLIPALLIGFQFSSSEEGFEEWRPEVLVVEGLADQVAEVECIVGHPALGHRSAMPQPPVRKAEFVTLVSRRF